MTSSDSAAGSSAIPSLAAISAASSTAGAAKTPCLRTIIGAPGRKTGGPITRSVCPGCPVGPTRKRAAHCQRLALLRSLGERRWFSGTRADAEDLEGARDFRPDAWVNLRCVQEDRWEASEGPLSGSHKQTLRSRKGTRARPRDSRGWEERLARAGSSPTSYVGAPGSSLTQTALSGAEMKGG